MRILYVASAVEAGGTSGGATHVREVACGLAALGHTVLAVTLHPTSQVPDEPNCKVLWRALPYRKELAMLGRGQLRRDFQRFKPDVVIERFYNFAGAGVWLAHVAGVPALLEVNAPMIDPPRALKTRLDALLFGAMRRWAVRQAEWSSAIVTPLSSTVPPEVPRGKIHELTWGANVGRFDPSVRGHERERLLILAAELGLAPGSRVVAFLGSFRAWHGVRHFAQAARRLIEGGSALSFLAIGGGPELVPVSQEVRGWGLPQGRFVFSGPQPHERIPDLLALADIGAAPFDLDAHAPLKAFGFYWSPLKVFEYMASGLPVVTIDVAPLNSIVRHEQEGLLYSSGDVSGLTSALARLESDRDLASKLGEGGRARVASNYSWEKHCEELDKLLRGMARV